MGLLLHPLPPPSHQSGQPERSWKMCHILSRPISFRVKATSVQSTRPRGILPDHRDLVSCSPSQPASATQVWLLCKSGRSSFRVSTLFSPSLEPVTHRHLHVFFKNYILLIMLLELSWFSPFPTSTQHPHSLRQSPHHCSCPWVMCIRSLASPYPILYFTSQRLSCNYLFVLLFLKCILPSYISCFILYFYRFYLFSFRERGREGEREGEKHQCARDRSVATRTLQMGTWPATQACALTGNRTFWFIGQCSVHRATPARAYLYFFVVVFFNKNHTPFLLVSPKEVSKLKAQITG